MNASAGDSRAAQLRMLRALDDASARIEALERGLNEPIAVIGLGCRFPAGSRDAASFWRSLRDGVDAIGDIPGDRWDAAAYFDPRPEQPGKICTQAGGFLGEVDRFDAEFFGISPREAVAMDPQQRLLLEVAHEALDGAGQLGDRLAENATGIFVGMTNNDYAHLLQRASGERPLDQYFVTGNSPNAAAGRISYLLGLRGPSLVVDTACSSSLVAVHLACQSLRSGDCRLALAGGVNLILSPEASVALSRARMLAPDGRCKTFDAAADGYGRGEGCGLLVLKRLAEARRDGDRILALIRGSAINQDGPTSGFTVPSGAAQRALLRSALAHARLAPAAIDYVEAHGTGTALGDPIEINALADVLGAGRAPGRPLLVGSVKTNIGHLESAAGAAGLIKAVLSLWHGEIPAHLHFRRPNPRIAWEDLPVQVVAAHTSWPPGPDPRRAGVSSFGVSGTNAHIILEQAPPESAAAALPAPRRSFRGERHWITPAAVGAAPSDDWFYGVEWPSQPLRARAAAGLADPAGQAEAVRRWIASAGPHPGGTAYAGVLARLEALSRRYALRAVRDVPAAGVVSAHRRLHARLRALAAEADGDSRDPGEEAGRLRAECPEAAGEITLLARCGERLADVLRGQCDPLTLLFPPGGAVAATDLYKNTPVARRMNELVGAAVAALAAPAASDPPLRVLEIGAGTGGTTTAVLSALPASAEYVFTDVSPLFLAQARERFKGRAGLRCQALDIEKDPLGQGFAPGQFDLVVAANVLHATRDLRAALGHARSLLAAGGRLVLLEATRPLGFLDLIFGLTDGWWRFADDDLRPAHPLLTPARWSEALTQAGLGESAAMAFSPSAGEIFASQSVITAQRREPAGAWLLLADCRGVATALAAALTRGGDACHLVFPGGTFAAKGERAWTIDPADPGDYRRALATAPDWRGVVHLWGLEADDPADMAPTRSALLLAQSLITQPAPLWVVTSGSVAASAGDAVSGMASTPLWGFARSLAQEHPEMNPVRIDLDPEAGAEDAAEALAAELLAPDGEDQIARRGGDRKVARLARLAPETPRPAVFSGDGTYLVIGGRGGLGQPLARWLVARGARHLVLTGRSAPDAAAEALVRELAAAGAEVRLERADAAVEADAARLLGVIAASPWPLRGLIHAAGVLDDGVVRQLTWDRLARVLEPKVAGAWHWHRLTLGLPLDFFVLFSSATSLLGSPGQANHAAANAFLDALAHHRRAAGLPATSINWGAWEEIGAAAERRVGLRFLAQGIRTIPPAEGWRALDRLLGAAPVQAAVLPVDWEAVPAALTRSPFFSGLRPAPSAVPETPAGFADLAAALPPTERRVRLAAEVRRQVAQILGLPGAERVDPRRGFFTLGMDSLTSVELRNRLQTALGRVLPATVVFDHPTAEALAAFLDSLWEGAPGKGWPSRAIAKPGEPTPTAGPGVEPIAVIGLGLRFPGGADSPEAFRRLLCGGIDAIAEVPPDRWSLEEFYDADPEARGKMYVRGGGFLGAVDRFDAGFFGVSPREAVAMDPQQRLLLETSWEALERAGVPPDSLGGSPTGVFVGICNHDYTERLLAAGPAGIDSYLGSGNAHSIAAGRISYSLGLQGPSLAIDTACSSSLVAVHLACQSLRAGECGLALAAGVNLLLSPTISVNHSRARMLAPDGRCKAFDASADGFGRSDGCGVVVLKRLAEAQRDGDRVLAVLLGSAVNQDGRTSGLTVPNGPAQQAVVRAALAQAGVEPADVGLIEAHGTGTALGDPIEMGALAAVFGPGRAPDHPLYVGSVKTNLGHCESAAGVAGLIKAVLAVAHGEIHAHLHFRNPNPLIPWDDLTWLRVPVATEPWPVGARRLAGVSSFGFGGTNAHVIVGEAPPGASEAPPPRGGEVLALSARDGPALRALAGSYAELLERLPVTAWPDVCHTAATGRARFSHRLVLGTGAVEAPEKLAAFARGEASAELWTGTAGEHPRVAFLFSGQGSLYAGMGQELYAGSAVYRAAFDACAALVKRHAGWDLAETIDSAERLARTEYGQVALFAVEFALGALWQDWGLLPDAVVGHSVGEYAAACVAGQLALEQALPLLIIRARLMGALGEFGAMAAVTGAEADVAGAIARHGVELGAVNSPRQVVLTGERSAMAAAVAELKAAGRGAQRLEVAQAYHSRQMEPMLAEFGRLASEILGDHRGPAIPVDCGAKFISTVTATAVAGELGGSDYWVRQVRQPVRFADAMAALHAERIDLVMEVGPRGILTMLGQQNWPDGTTVWLTSLAPGREDWAQLQESAGRAWTGGAPVDWIEVFHGHPRPRVALPTYPFQRRRYWCDEPAAAPPPPTFELVWEAAVPGAASAAAAGPWRLLGGSPGLRRELTRELARRGRATTEEPAARVAGIAFLADELGAVENPPEAAAAVCERLRQIVRERLAGASSARLWIVTRGAVVAAPGDGRSLALAAAPLWGFGKALALEHPELSGGLLDLDPAAAPDEAARVVEAWLAPGADDQMALRGGAWRAPRLRPRPLAAGKALVRSDGAYLVTGGLGALGLRVAAWLAARGAGHLVLLGRRPPAPGAEAEIARLRAGGSRVTVQAMDAADGPALARLIAATPLLRGVVHAAGLPGFAPAENLEAGELAAVLRPKIGGAWALHEATRGAGLDFFVMFSSIASAWGSKGQTHYAAANQFLDGLAHQRRALGLPALSVNWGPWAGGGMATRETQDLLARAGVGALAPEDALAILGSALAAEATQLAAARIDWPRFRAVFESRGPRPLLGPFGGAPAAPAGPGAGLSGLPAELAALGEADRVLRLRALAGATIAQVLRLPAGETPSARQGFSEMGIDSLLAVEIRNRLASALGLALPATLVFDHPEIERLSRFLAAQFGPAAPGPEPDEPDAAALSEARHRLARMTEEEAEAWLLKKLEDL